MSTQDQVFSCSFPLVSFRPYIGMPYTYRYIELFSFLFFFALDLHVLGALHVNLCMPCNVDRCVCMGWLLLLVVLFYTSDKFGLRWEGIYMGVVTARFPLHLHGLAVLVAKPHVMHLGSRHRSCAGQACLLSSHSWLVCGLGSDLGGWSSCSVIDHIHGHFHIPLAAYIFLWSIV